MSDWSTVLHDDAPPAGLISATSMRPRQPWYDLARGVATVAVFEALEAIAHDRRCLARLRDPAPVDWVAISGGGIAVRCPDCAAFVVVGSAAPASRQRSRHGPAPMTTPEAVAGARADLEAQEAASAAVEGRAARSVGERKIAAKLGVSKGAVRYALGKDRHRS